MKFTKIWKSIDLRNNKIFNAKTDLPIEDDHITPKLYVDDLTTFNTKNANFFNISSAFSWLTDFKDRPIKDILDDLFFPVIQPTYINPEYYNVFLTDFDEYNIVGEKKAIFLNKFIKLKIDYQISESDRLSGVVPKIIIKSNTGTINEYPGLTTSDTEGFIEFEFMFVNIQSIKLRKVFKQATTQKVNNYGDVYIPNDFTFNYNLDFDVLSLLNDNYDLYPPMLNYKKPSNKTWQNIIESITNGNNLVDNPNLTLFTKDNKFNVVGNDNIYIIGIPEPLYNKAIIKLHIDKSIKFFNIPMLKANLDMSSSYNNIKSLLYYDKTINYYFGIIDLGSFENQKPVIFQYDLFNSTSIYGQQKNSLSWLINEFNNLKNATIANQGTSNIIPQESLTIYKVYPNSDNTKLEINDTVTGYVEGQFLSDATYIGGNPQLLSSYDL